MAHFCLEKMTARNWTLRADVYSGSKSRKWQINNIIVYSRCKIYYFVAEELCERKWLRRQEELLQVDETSILTKKYNRMNQFSCK